MVAASAALTISGVPFMGPIGAARVGYKDGEYQLNPSLDEVKTGELDLVVAATDNAVMMVESEAKELSEDVMLGAVMFAHKASQQVINAIIKLAEKAAKDPWEIDLHGDNTADMKAKLKKLIGSDIAAAYKITDKSKRSNALNEARAKAKAAFADSRARRTQMVANKLDEEAGSGNRARRHPQGRPAHRRPHDHADPSDRGDGRLPAAHAWLGPVHARRDAVDLHDHAGHQGRRADDRRPGPACPTRLHAAL